eukprot:COSAG02_NODE_26_length_51927_cov_61.213881_3_plen_594_part_00
MVRESVLSAVDWFTQEFVVWYERILDRLDAAGSWGATMQQLQPAWSDWPLVDTPAVPDLPDGIDRLLSTFGLHASAIDMDGVVPSMLCAWAVVSLVFRRWLNGNGRRETSGAAHKDVSPVMLRPGSWWLTRIVFLRCLGGVYLTAFLVALHQNPALLGERGLLPASVHMQQLRAKLTPHDGTTLRGAWTGFLRVPGLLWFVAPGGEESALTAFAFLGIALAAVLLIRGASNMPIMGLLWILYTSIVMAGQRWYSFGWESQLLETGFLAMFLTPVLSLAAMPRHTPTPLVTRCGFIWLIFRIMIGAGLIKVRGDQCWRDLTCMDYHYETQPVPNPVAWFLHANFAKIHMLEVLANHFVELVAPWLLLPMLPRTCRILGGIIQILFQCVLIVSGNLSFLNWLTALPAIFCFDDRFLAPLFSNALCQRVNELQKATSATLQKESVAVRELSRSRSRSPSPSPTTGAASNGSHWPLNGLRRLSVAGCWQSSRSAASTVVSVALGLSLFYLSVPVIRNLLQLDGRQAMNTSFGSWKIVNTYGAFGSITKTRTEIILEGTLDTDPTAESAVWLEYEFKCKPGNVTRTPCAITPYHYRLE